MFSKPLAFVLAALVCVTAAAGGAYLATRHNAAETAVLTAAPQPEPATAAPAAGAAVPASQPVAETEAKVTGARSGAPEPRKAEKETPDEAVASRRPEPPARKPAADGLAQAPRNGGTEPTAPRTVPMTAGAASGQPEPLPPIQAAAPPAPEPPKPVDPQPEAPRVPQFEEVILPASSVIGLQLETSLSSDRARLEDRVEARVSRDVMAAGRVAIPVGARVIGTVIEVDKGGKLKTPARLGIRFHTVILTDGSEVALRTEPIYRDGESPARDSAKKIGGGAIAGMILGGILGGGKGAAVGGATGAAGGTAAAMSGDRATVTIASGQFLNARLSSPATITVERRE